MSLRKVWNKMAFKFAAIDIYNPSEKVRVALQEQGWQFKRETVSSYSGVGGFSAIGAMGGGLIPGAISYTIPYTPEGESVFGSEENEARYKTAWQSVAKKIYKQDAPSP